MMRRFSLTGRLLDGLGWGGAAASLAAYTLNSHGVLGSQSLPYLLLNVLGCGLLIVYTYRKRAFANTTLNSIWLLVTLAALGKPVFNSVRPRLESVISHLTAPTTPTRPTASPVSAHAAWPGTSTRGNSLKPSKNRQLATAK